MPNLGYMLPTDEKHENAIREISRSRHRSISDILDYLIECEYVEEFGKEIKK
jgi:hypothetical protein